MPKYLDMVSGGVSLNELSYDELDILSYEIREYLLDNVSVNGGHLASNLGVVELTIALNMAFDMPHDKILFDVGHQCYTHKILNGRKNSFHTLRQKGGVGGFPNPNEDVSDAFRTGHASTSIAASIGMAVARDLKGDNFYVAAVIGDGAMTGGLAFEGLNNVSNIHSGLIVVLNDNDMSISTNVGGLSNYLSRLRTNPKIRKFQLSMESYVKRIPLIGKGLAYIGHKIKEFIKSIVIPRNVYFEEMGMIYTGPVDGHNIKMLKHYLDMAKRADRPVLLHVVTQKGRGFNPAISRPDVFHGVGKFDRHNGDIEAKLDRTFTQAFSDAMCDIGKDKRVITITAAMKDGTGLSKFAQMYSDRFFDCGIAEQFGVTYASGLAKCNMRPFMAVYSTFLQRAYDQIVHDVALQNLPVIFMIDRAGLVGEDGPTHQGTFDIAYLRNIPNMVVMAPKDESELVQMMQLALEIDGPSSIRYPKDALDVYEKSEKVILGKAEILRSEGIYVIIALGPMCKVAMEASEILKKCGIEVKILNARFVKPLDGESIMQICNGCKAAFTLEDGVRLGGFGSSVLELFADEAVFDFKVHVLGVEDHFFEHAKRSELIADAGLDACSVAKYIRNYHESLS